MNPNEHDSLAETTKPEDELEARTENETEVDLKEEDLQNISGGKKDHLIP